MTRSLFLEAMNGFLGILMVYSAVAFLLYIWVNRGEGYQNLRPAISLIPIFVGEAFIRMMIWYERHQVNNIIGYKLDFDVWFYLYSLLGLCMLTVGIVCVIKVFIYDFCGPKSWILAILLGIVWVVGWMLYGAI